MPGSALPATMAAVMETAVIDPYCRNMPASVAESSGASCSVALLDEGVEIPMPMPHIPVAIARQA